jgi:transposase InsO family protein
MLSSTAQAAICTARRRTGWGPRLIAGELGRPHSTVWKTLRRHGLSRLVRPPRPAARRYEWPCPGDLLHMDTKRYARFERPGHAMTGVRTRTGAERRARWGYEYAHTIVDDHTRLAYSELHADERAVTVTGFVERALDWFTAHGISCQRVMTDNAWAYVHNKALKELLEQRGVRHLTIQPRRPQTNGKVERFHQTMSREWAYGQTYASHPATPPCRTGSRTTTPAVRTAHSAPDRPSHPFTTSDEAPGNCGGSRARRGAFEYAPRSIVSSTMWGRSTDVRARWHRRN